MLIAEFCFAMICGNLDCYVVVDMKGDGARFWDAEEV